MEEDRSVSCKRVVEKVLNCVIPYVDDPKDRAAVSQVCKHGYEVDSVTRKHVTIALCYTTTPARLRRRFPNLESLKLKGKPRSAMFNSMLKYWAGHVTPWVSEIKHFNCLKSLHFRRMMVKDNDLLLLAESRGPGLHSLKLDMCCGFSTDGLLHVGRLCRNLRELFFEDSSIDEKDGEWLHELAVNNTVLESLNFYLTSVAAVKIEDLELLAKNCPNLVSVKITQYKISNLVNFFRQASSLEEFCGGIYNEEPERYSAVSLPAKLCRLGLTYIRKNELPIMLRFAAALTKLDLIYALLDTDDQCMLIQKCPNLEVLKTTTVIGDRGLEVLSNCCKRLKRLRIERDYRVGGTVSHRGLIALSEGCSELEYLAVDVTDINNASLEHMGTHLRNLCDFRLALLDQEEKITDLPLDRGVRALLRGCDKLKRFALSLRQGGLTDVGLGYIGQYSQNVRWMLLGVVGKTDEGLLEFAKGCPNLQKLEMRGCTFFSEHALAVAATQLTSLRYLSVQGFGASRSGRDLLAMARPFWNMEFVPPRRAVAFNNPAEILAYYSLAGQRSDLPDYVVPLGPATFVEP